MQRILVILLCLISMPSKLSAMDKIPANLMPLSSYEEPPTFEVIDSYRSIAIPQPNPPHQLTRILVDESPSFPAPPAPPPSPEELLLHAPFEDLSACDDPAAQIIAPPIQQPNRPIPQTQPALDVAMFIALRRSISEYWAKANASRPPTGIRRPITKHPVAMTLFSLPNAIPYLEQKPLPGIEIACHVCEAPFSNLDELNSHLPIHLPCKKGKAPLSQSRVAYRAKKRECCPVCNKEYDIYYLSEHIQARHPEHPQRHKK